MPIFDVTGPDKKAYSVNAPEGATREQAIQFVQEKYYPQYSATVRAGEEAIATPPASLASTAKAFARGNIPTAAGATAGGALGLMGGPAAPITVPAGIMIGGAAVPLADAGTKIAQKVTGKTWPLPSEHLSGYMEKMGYPAPRNTVERAAEAAGQGFAGAATAAPAAGILARTAPSPVTRGVMRALGDRPDAQMVAQPIGAAAGEYVTEKTGSPTAGMLAGGLAGMAGTPATASTVRRLVTPFPTRLPGDQQRLVGVAQREGIPLTLSQRTGSPTLRNTEAVLSTLPFSSDMLADTADNQRAAFNRAVMRIAGVDADRATPDVLDRAFRGWGTEFDNTVGQVPVLFPDRSFVRELADVGQNVEQNGAGVFERKRASVRALVPQGNSPIDPRRLLAVRSDIGDTARTTNDPSLKAALRDLQGVLDGLIERQAPPAIAGDLQNLRRRYSALMVVDDAMGGGTQGDRSIGNIPLAAFRSAVDRSDSYGYARGRGQYNDLSRVADFLGSNNVPDSGTARRMWVQGLLAGGGGIAALQNAAAHPIATAVAVGTAVGVPAAVSTAMNSRIGQRYLGNQVLPGPASNWTHRRLADAIAGSTGSLRATSSAEPLSVENLNQLLRQEYARLPARVN